MLLSLFIVIVDKINQRRVGRTNIIRVIFESCKERLRPELITFLMKTIGLLPMVLSRDEAASMWTSLALTVLCGTITGTMLTLLIIPTAYYLLENPKRSLKGIFKNLDFLFNLVGLGKEKKISGGTKKTQLLPKLELPGLKKKEEEPKEDEERRR